MKTKNVQLTLDKAREWYSKGGELKEVALQAFTEEELKVADFKCIVTMNDVLKVLNIRVMEYCSIVCKLKQYSKASAATYTLNLVRKALNMGYEMEFSRGEVWYPYTPIVTSDSYYIRQENKITVAKVKIDSKVFSLLGGDALNGGVAGLGAFDSNNGVGYSAANVGFLGCATKEIAEHMGKYFGKEIFEAKYGDTIEYEWI